MATITVQYDARNTAFKHLLQLIIDMGGKITKVEDKTFVDSTAKDIAKRYSDVKSGRTKTRPVSALINEL